MSRTIRIVHYLNQFFAGLGGEESARATPSCHRGAKGPGQLIARIDKGVEVVATLSAGDDYVAEHLETATDELLSLLRCEVDLNTVDAVIAGPAFNAGRYGMACAALCRRVERELNIPAIAALYPDNPAVEPYRRHVSLVRAGDDVMSMADDVSRMLRVLKQRIEDGGVMAPSDDLIPRGVRQNYFSSATGAERAVSMLVDRIANREVSSEYAMPKFDRVPPAAAVKRVADAVIALVTSGGIVPKGNPDRIESANASRFGEYSIGKIERLTSQTHQSVHGGYDPTFANADPNRVLPLDAARELEREGRIGRLHSSYFATVGNATSVERAKRYGAEIAAKLVNEGVQAVVFTST